MLRQFHRQGFTLPELLIAAVLMLIVAGAAHQLVVTTQRLARTQVEQVNLQSNVRSGALVVANELRELSTVAGGSSSQNDILQIAPSDITYRAMRGIGFICQAPSATQIRIGLMDFSGYRDPQATRDSALVFLQGSEETGVADSWLPVAITDVSQSAPCPGARPGITLTVPSVPLLSALELGTPVRVYEVMQLKLYQSKGESWLGARSVSGGELAIQPVVGPLAGPDGFQLNYLDSQGSPTTELSAVSSISYTLRGLSTEAVRSGGREATRLEDGLTTQVALRNASWE
jgi:prepilin-type N-terminal cleavage/methylation domain-containing protein